MSAAASGPETLVRDILQGLADGRFVPGQRLSEPDLMARFGIGRSTVREALGRLAALAIVELAPHRGAQIRRLSRKGAEDVLRVAAALLELAARQAAEAVERGADPTPLAEAARDYSANPEARARYYRALTGLARNAELERLLPLVQMQLVRAQLRGIASAENRAAMVLVITRGLPTAAAIAARVHVGALIAALPDAPAGAFAPD